MMAIEDEVCEELEGAMPPEYARQIADRIIDDVNEDLMASADNEFWSTGDLRMSIGRVLCRSLGISV